MLSNDEIKNYRADVFFSGKFFYNFMIKYLDRAPNPETTSQTFAEIDRFLKNVSTYTSWFLITWLNDRPYLGGDIKHNMYSLNSYCLTLSCIDCITHMKGPEWI